MVRRLLSWWWDYLLILAWLLLVVAVVGVPQLVGWWDLSSVWSNPAAADVAITVLTVVPYFLYLVLTEMRTPHATWGKRRVGWQLPQPHHRSPTGWRLDRCCSSP